MSVPTGALAPPGGHSLPPHLSGSSRVRPAARPQRSRTPLFIGLGVAAVLIGGGTLQLTANLGYDAARDEFATALDAAQSAEESALQELADLDSATAAAGQIRAADAGALSDAATGAALDTVIAEAGAASLDAADQLAAEMPSAAPKPGAFWELFAASGTLTADAAEIGTISDEFEALLPVLTETDSELSTAGLAHLHAAAAAAPAFESAHLSAKNDAVIELRTSAAVVAGSVAVDQDSAVAYAALQQAANAVIVSEEAELAEKAGPLLATRLDIEAFARSLAPGVLLEFDWNTIVNGVGLNGSMGGLTTWWWDDPDRAIIELSNSVAEQWPSERSRALVAHEVGHAISVKCEDMYDSSTQENIESWATAWAISMGFTDDANGVWAYGYPAQSFIDAAAGCR